MLVLLQVLGKGDSPAGLTAQVNEVTTYFCYLGVVSFVASFFQMSMWTITGESSPYMIAV